MAWSGAMNCGAFICQQQCLGMAEGQPGFWDLASVPCEVLRESGIWTPQPFTGTQDPESWFQDSPAARRSYCGNSGEQGARVKQGGADKERDWDTERDGVRGCRQELARKGWTSWNSLLVGFCHTGRLKPCSSALSGNNVWNIPEYSCC